MPKIKGKNKLAKAKKNLENPAKDPDISAVSKKTENAKYKEYLKKKAKFEKAKKSGKEFKDSDHDGLTDFEEKYIYGTDPRRKDTDNDGLNDGQEVKKGRNPLGKGTLKDLFIPHTGNLYAPHILQPRRLVFHAVSLITIKFIAVVLVVFYPLTAWLSLDVAMAEVKKIIDLTNDLRVQAKAEPLAENQKLNQAAWQKIEDMFLNQYFAHVSPSGVGLDKWLKKVGYKYLTAGENLAVGYANAEEVVAAWQKSPTHYENIIDTSFKDIGVAIADGRFQEVDTILAAQYFAQPRLTAAVLMSPPPVVAPIADLAKTKEAEAPPVVETPTAPAGEPVIENNLLPGLATTTVSGGIGTTLKQEVEGEKAEDNLLDLSLNFAPSALEGNITIQGDNISYVRVLRAEVKLPPEITSAVVIVHDKQIRLTKADANDSWIGSSFLSRQEEKRIFQNLVPATVVMENQAGQKTNVALDWKGVTPIRTSTFDRYRLFKDYPTSNMLPVLIFSSFYFKILLVIFTLAAILNFFVEIKKQKLRLVASSLGMVGLLILLIIF